MNLSSKDCKVSVLLLAAESSQRGKKSVKARKKPQKKQNFEGHKDWHGENGGLLLGGRWTTKSCLTGEPGLTQRDHWSHSIFPCQVDSASLYHVNRWERHGNHKIWFAESSPAMQLLCVLKDSHKLEDVFVNSHI